MKRIFTLLAAVFLTLTAFAFDQNRFSITAVAGNDYIVEIDGRRHKMDKGELVLRNLKTGYHTVQIFRDRRQQVRGRRAVNQRQMIYNGRVFLKNGYHYDLSINRFGKAFADERSIRNVDNDDDDDFDRIEGRALTAREFDRAMKSLRDETFDSRRFAEAKRVIDANRFTSAQVKQMLQLFRMESHKLELAKYAYGKTVDKRNYDTVMSVFAFNSSRQELQRYMREY